MPVYLGIDTGGTYTDAVLFDPDRGVLASAKALTRRHDLTLGIRESLQGALDRFPDEPVELVCLSTTLATNAVVEGQGSPICLLLIGYPPDSLDQCGLREALGRDPVVFIDGGHDVAGEEARSLDLEAARRAVERFAPSAAAFAVSGYFSVRNPSHENRVRALIREVTGLPVTCGHEISANLHASRRALTAALNARLVPVLTRLIEAVQHMAAERGIAAPLMVVKGDGSLIAAGMAAEYPIETVLSGPAASVVGSLHLSGEKDACIADMGGTTTDIALVRGGRPVLNREGAVVGGWHTMVEAVQIHTCGLGGDSEVRFDDDGLALGPRRHVPLSLLAHEHPGVIPALECQCARPAAGPVDGRFLLLQRPPEQGFQPSPLQAAILERLADGPLAQEALLPKDLSTILVDLELRGLVERGLVAFSAFTPSDAAHVLGYQDSWSAEAARLGARLAARAWTAGAAADAGAFCREVLRRVTVQSGRAVLAAALSEAHGIDLSAHPAVQQVFVDRAVSLAADGRAADGTGLIDVAVTLNLPLVAIGAPVPTYYPAVARGLHTRLAIPPHAEVANAVGAVVGSVTQRVEVLITPRSEGECFRVHCEEGIEDFDELERAVEFASRKARDEAARLADLAGVFAARLEVVRRDQAINVHGQELFLESRVTATAAGRPRLAHERGGPSRG